MGVADAHFFLVGFLLCLYDFFTNFLDQFYARSFSIKGGGCVTARAHSCIKAKMMLW
jgi:hypothetical protein